MEVRRETVFDAEPAEVWDALTAPDRLAEWFANDVELDVRPGGEGTFRWDDGSIRHARVQRLEDGRELELLWWDDAGAESVVAISLDECGEGTRVTVTESATKLGLQASAEWSWGIELLASLARLRRPARLH